jgi:hypothetical protein
LPVALDEERESDDRIDEMIESTSVRAIYEQLQFDFSPTSRWRPATVVQAGSQAAQGGGMYGVTSVTRRPGGRIGRFWAAALVFAAAGALLPTGSMASKPRVEFLKRVSGVSPFPGPCGRDPRVFVMNAESEPTIAVKSGHPRRLAVAWMQDGLRSNVVATSRNGGRTWSRALVPGLSVCTGGTQEFAADPWLSFGPRGRLYLGSATGRFAAGGT